jgi:hypothetical protein
MPVQPRIKGLSEIRRLPRLGKIRLGIKVEKKLPDGSTVTYPKEVDHFVVPPEVAEKYGEKPKSLDVMFPPADETRFFTQQYKAYVQQGLRCRGDGERANRRAADLVWIRKKDGKILDDANARLLQEIPKEADHNALVEIGCRDPEKGPGCPLVDEGVCRAQGVLFVILPKISMGGVYQITTGSWNNIVAMNSIVDWLKASTPPFNRVVLIPFVLTREPEEIEYEGKKSVHWLLKPRLPYTLEDMIKLQGSAQALFAPTERLALPVPVDDGPDDTPGAVLVEEDSPEAARAAAATAVPQPPAPAQAPPAAAPPQPTQVHYPATKWELGVLEELGKAVTGTGVDMLWDRQYPTIETKPAPVRKRLEQAFKDRLDAIGAKPKPPAQGEPPPAQGRIL